MIELINDTTFWIGFALPFFVALCLLFASFTNLRHTRIMEDTPTSKIRSAAQGYVELEGHQHALGEPLKAELSQIPCTWYHCQIEKKVTQVTSKGTKTHWDTIYQNTSQALFLLKDETGECIIDPKGAQVKPDTVSCWYGHSKKPGPIPKTWWQKFWAGFGSYRYIEKRMNIDAPIYAIGMFQTLNIPRIAADCAKDSDSPAVVKSWLNSDLKQLEQYSDKAHVLSRHGLPKRRPFLISAFPQQKIINQHRLKAFFYFAGFILLGAISFSYF